MPPRSPLAPETDAEPAADRRRAARGAGLRRPLQGPQRRLPDGVRPRHHHRRRADPLAHRLGAGRLVPRGAEGRAGAGDPGQFRQRQCLHRQGWARPRCARCAAAAAAALGCAPEEVFLASTGVIGEPLADEQHHRRPAGSDRGICAEDGWAAAAAAIMTTDTFPKLATRHGARSAGCTVTHQRHRQGLRHDRARHGDHAGLRRHRRQAAGRRCCSALLREAADRSFNCITVDGDTSTSDTLLLAATGAGRHMPRIARRRRSEAAAISAPSSQDLLIDLACQVVRDGEGARSSSPSTSRAPPPTPRPGASASPIANSPLVKTAIAGEDANWGRIVMAVGKAGEKADRDRLKIAIGGVTVAAQRPARARTTTRRRSPPT